MNLDLHSLQIVWFVLIAVLWVGFFVLEGFDYGVGTLLRTIGRTESERRAVLTTLGPVWDGNEVWLLVAGGATFAAFPEWYATLFSGFALPLLLILVALIIRGVSFEYRSKRSGARWRRSFDTAIVIGSALPAILWGVAFANIVAGTKLAVLDGHVEYVGNVLDLLNPYALLGGLTTFSLFVTHGAYFLALKTDGTIRVRANAVGRRVSLLAAALAVGFGCWTQLAHSEKAWTWIVLAVAAGSWLLAAYANGRGREGWAFGSSAVAIGAVVAFLFCILFPDVMPSSLDPADSLTIVNASSTEYTLRVMSVVALVFTPLVLLYQGWTYWVFRARLSPSLIADPEHGALDLPGEGPDVAAPTALSQS